MPRKLCWATSLPRRSTSITPSPIWTPSSRTPPSPARASRRATVRPPSVATVSARLKTWAPLPSVSRARSGSRVSAPGPRRLPCTNRGPAAGQHDPAHRVHVIASFALTRRDDRLRPAKDRRRSARHRPSRCRRCRCRADPAVRAAPGMSAAQERTSFDDMKKKYFPSGLTYGRELLRSLRVHAGPRLIGSLQRSSGFRNTT